MPTHPFMSLIHPHTYESYALFTTEQDQANRFLEDISRLDPNVLVVVPSDDLNQRSTVNPVIGHVLGCVTQRRERNEPAYTHVWFYGFAFMEMPVMVKQIQNQCRITLGLDTGFVYSRPTDRFVDWFTWLPFGSTGEFKNIIPSFLTPETFGVCVVMEATHEFDLYTAFGGKRFVPPYDRVMYHRNLDEIWEPAGEHHSE